MRISKRKSQKLPLLLIMTVYESQIQLMCFIVTVWVWLDQICPSNCHRILFKMSLNSDRDTKVRDITLFHFKPVDEARSKTQTQLWQNIVFSFRNLSQRVSKVLKM